MLSCRHEGEPWEGLLHQLGGGGTKSFSDNTHRRTSLTQVQPGKPLSLLDLFQERGLSWDSCSPEKTQPGGWQLPRAAWIESLLCPLLPILPKALTSWGRITDSWERGQNLWGGSNDPPTPFLQEHQPLLRKGSPSCSLGFRWYWSRCAQKHLPTAGGSQLEAAPLSGLNSLIRASWREGYRRSPPVTFPLLLQSPRLEWK